MGPVASGFYPWPPLFLIYTNDLPRSSSKLTFYSFADDTNSHYECNNLDMLQRTVKKELRKVKTRLDVNKLSLNIDETNLKICKSRQHPSTEAVRITVRIKIGNLTIKKISYVKFLGVLLDGNLSWKYHLTELSKSLLEPVACSSK